MKKLSPKDKQRIVDGMEKVFPPPSVPQPRLIQNAIQCADGTIINSLHRHDFQRHGDNFVDGGLDYIRSGGNMEKAKQLHLYDNFSLEQCIQDMVWGTYGKDGKQPLKWVFLRECTTDHLKAILKTQKGISPRTKEVIETILRRREAAINNDTTVSLKGTNETWD